MPYKISERLQQDRPPSSPISWLKDHDYALTAKIFLVYSALSFLTAWCYSWETERVYHDSMILHQDIRQPQAEIDAEAAQEAASGEETGQESSTLIGPITVRKFNAVYTIAIRSPLSENTWAYIEGEVLDRNKNFLFSFGKELWHETGYDDEGQWNESDDSYDMKVTFPTPSTYYIKLKSQTNYALPQAEVTVTRRNGSSIPHMVFGMVTLLIGLYLNEKANRTFTRSYKKMQRYSDD
jgi:hypothetical protein